MKDYRSLFNKKIADEKILDSIEDRVAYGTDASLLESLPSIIVLVYTQEDFDNAIKICTESKLKFLVRGKATGYTGGCVPQKDSVVISLENWKGLIEFNELEETAIFAPGTTISEINSFAETKKLFFPPDPISKDHCSLGGAISENSSGPRCLRFGPLHCFIESFQFYNVDGNENIIKKDDFTNISDYFYSIVGSEGTLGAVGWIKVRLVKKPKETLLFCMEFNESNIINQLLEKCFISGIPFSAMEMITPSYHTEKGRVGKYYLLLEYFSYCDRDKKVFYDKLNEYTKSLPVEITTPEGTIYDVRGKAYQTNRKLINDLIQKRPISLLVDGVVPRTALQQLVEEIFNISEENNIPMLDTFHFSDGNIHPTFFFENNEKGNIEKHKILGLVMEKCIKLGGSLAAEHGIGLEKIDYIVKKHNNDEIDEFYKIKSFFDKDNNMNPGKVLPDIKPISKFVNEKFNVDNKIMIDKINMTVVVDATITLKELRDECNKQNLNIGYISLCEDENLTILEEIRKCNKNLLSKRHGELKDSILGIMFNENGRDVVFGDRLVKNVSGYNICRSNKVLSKDIKKICLRVYNNNDNKYYKLNCLKITNELLLEVNEISHDFTPLLVFDNDKTFIIFSSIYTKDELKHLSCIEEIDIKEIHKYKMDFVKKQKLEFDNIRKEENVVYNYQKEEMYYNEY